MSCLWTCLILLFVAPFLQNSASFTAGVTNPGVSVECNQTVETVAGEAVTLNCTIMIDHNDVNCTGESYDWSNTHGEIQCNSGSAEYNCDWDNLTYVSLTMSNVMEDGNYTILIVTDCGTAQSHTKLQVKQNSIERERTIGSTPHTEQATNLHVTAVILSIFIALVVFGILFFLFGTKQGRAITACKETQGDPKSEQGTPCLLKCENCQYKCEICV